MDKLPHRPLAIRISLLTQKCRVRLWRIRVKRSFCKARLGVGVRGFSLQQRKSDRLCRSSARHGYAECCASILERYSGNRQSQRRADSRRAFDGAMHRWRDFSIRSRQSWSCIAITKRRRLSNHQQRIIGVPTVRGSGQIQQKALFEAREVINLAPEMPIRYPYRLLQSSSAL